MTRNHNEAYLATAEAMLTAEGMTEAAELLRGAEAEVLETGYDNLNGGTHFYTVYLTIDPANYGRLGTKRARLEEEITARMKAVYERDDNSSYTVSIRPRVRARTDWRTPSMTVSRHVRRNIIDGLMIDKVAWMGTLDDVEFLQRLWDLRVWPRIG